MSHGHDSCCSNDHCAADERSDAHEHANDHRSHAHDYGGHEHATAASPSGSTAAPDSDRTRLHVPGLCCDAEANLIRKRFARLDGISDVAVNLVGKSVDVRHDQRTLAAERLVSALSEVGLDAELVSRATPRVAAETSPFPVPLGLAAALLVVSLASYWLEPLRFAALGAVALGVWPILRRTWGALKSRLFDMNVLMTVAIAGALALGEWIEGAAVVVLFGLSVWLEDRSMARARHALRDVADLVPEVATRADTGASVPVGDLVVGDRVAVKSGARVPIDGQVVSGTSSVDESALTGESLPVAKGPGDAVSAGTVNGTGYLVVEATAPAGDSAVARLIRLVDEAQAARSPTERFVDRFAAVYTPVVIVAAALVAVVPPLLFAGAWTEWIYRSLVLLVVACPCALVIATPVAVVSAMARAARDGVLIKGGVHLETLGRVRALALDKTGTLTRGRFEVAECVPLNGHSEAELDALIAVAEHASSHPLAEALLEHTGRPDPDRVEALSTYNVVEGEGIEADVDGRRVVVGNHRMAERLGWCGEAEHPTFEDWVGRGWTVLYAGVDGKLAGLHGLADRPRPEAASAVEALTGLGLDLTMLTGDNAGSAESIRRSLGLANARAELRPEDKVAAVEALRRERGVVGMVGDGVNDAPALAVADVGIAMGVRGTAVAMETADVALMSDDLGGLASVIRLGRRAARVIRRNIVFALAVKALVLILAVVGVANLWMAVGADVGATLAVVGYSMTLLKG